jgi:hypothetical protein
MRHYAISRKTAGSIPYQAIGFFSSILRNPSCRMMAMGSAQIETEMSVRNLREG